MTNKICVIGLGYVGLPIAIAFAEKMSVFGFYTNPVSVEESVSGYNRTIVNSTRTSASI